MNKKLLVTLGLCALIQISCAGNRSLEPEDGITPGEDSSQGSTEAPVPEATPGSNPVATPVATPIVKEPVHTPDLLAEFNRFRIAPMVRPFFPMTLPMSAGFSLIL